MKPKILNYGSLNIDKVYRVPHFVKPGETLTCSSLESFAGGKGANQSVALARAGATVFHAGKIGGDGLWLKEKLNSNGVNTQFISTCLEGSGHAMIQVDNLGENSIILYSGANQEINKEDIQNTLSKFEAGDYLLLQNEINLVDYLIKEGSERGLHVCFNPAPFDKNILRYPLKFIKMLIVNEVEGAGLTGKQSEIAIIDQLHQLLPHVEIILTVGKKGAYYRYKNESIHIPAEQINVVDTTAAGDTFIGYFLAARLQDKPIKEALKIATHASALCISKKGAIDSIPVSNLLRESDPF